MEIIKIKGENFANCYVIMDSNQFILVDPSRSINKFIKEMNNEGVLVNKENIIFSKQNYSQNALHSTLHNTEKFVCLGVFVTHSHFDHIFCIEEWQEAGANVFCSKNAINNANNEITNASFFFNKHCYKIKNEIVVCDNDIVKVGNKNFKVLETSGHTDCSISLLGQDDYGYNVLFCGDLLFENGGVGRTDLPTGNEKLLAQSLNKIMNIKKPLKVYPGHGNVFVIND